MNVLSTLIFSLIVTALLVSSCNQRSNYTQHAKEATAKEIVSQTPLKNEEKLVCAVHNAPKKACFICDESLREKKRLWCKEHNRYEDRCFICHPEAQDKSNLYCSEHGLYEKECFICHPELVPHDSKEKAETKQPTEVDIICKEHGMPEREDGICHPELLGALKPGQGLKVRFESTQSAEKAGIAVTLPESSLVKGEISFPARTAFNESASLMVIARYAGTIISVKADLGSVVKKGDVLAIISSPELARIVAEFRSTESDARVKETEYLREKDLFEKNVSSRQEMDNAFAMFNRTRNSSDAIKQQLMNAGISSENISDILTKSSFSSEFSVRAPVSGTVTQRSVAVGQNVVPETPIMTIVDLSSLWVHVSVPAPISTKLQIGDVLSIAIEESRTVPAKIDWISPEIDQASGSVNIRAILKNANRTIKSGMLCKAFFKNDGSKSALVIAANAMVKIDAMDFVFIKIESDLYEVRRVALEGITDGKAIISQGLALIDKVVVQGTFVVKSELLKSRLGAGCVDD